ncbi:MAG TPA: DUF115 domain-containing protein [Spirochaetota bacterium]|nr:DUF115 domain-containing protein [Spirochaetota bacterium]
MQQQNLYQALNQGLILERYTCIKRNIEKNKVLIAKWGGLQKVVSLLSGKHVIVCGAGKSLDDATKVLRKYQHRNDLVIIAADMAYKPLVVNGINPQFTISCEAMPVPYYAFLPTSSCHLLAFSGVNSITAGTWKGRISFYNWMIYDEPFKLLWKIAGEHLGYVATASIVTTQAISLSLGCPIASLSIVGNDLAFKHSYYAGNTVVSERFLMEYNRCNTANTQDYAMIQKKKMYIVKRRESIYYTDHQFLAARQWLEDLFSQITVPVYDCSVPGCAENKVIKIAINKVMNKLYPEKKPKKKRQS